MAVMTSARVRDMPGTRRPRGTDPADPLAPARVSYLWGDPTGPGPSGVFVRVPAGAAATVSAPGALHAVVVQGAVASGGGAGAALAVGSLLSVSGGEPLPLSCRAAADCTVYIRAEGALDFPGG